MKLLSLGKTNAKLAKSDNDKYLTAILYMSPHTISGKNLCPHASAGCASSCLNTAGRGAFSNVQNARLRKARLFIEDRTEFTKQLFEDIQKLERKALKQGKIPVVRLNGTTDIRFPFQIFDSFPSVQFYDYTKDFNRLRLLKQRQLAGKAKNYHLTFSLSESNDAQATQALNMGFNVAAVFRSLPPRYMDSVVVNGDKHDNRFLNKPMISGRGVVVGLTAKGKARKDQSGFVRD